MAGARVRLLQQTVSAVLRQLIEIFSESKNASFVASSVAFGWRTNDYLHPVLKEPLKCCTGSLEDSG